MSSLLASFCQCALEPTSPIPSFALLHPNHHALTIQIAHFEVHHLTDPKPRRIGGHQQTAVSELRGGAEQSLHFLRAEDLRQSPGPLSRGKEEFLLVPSQNLLVDALQPADGHVYGARR